jgi:hypothetical protein
VKYVGDKEVNRFVRDLVRSGWRFRRGGKHAKLYPPDPGKFLTIATSPSDAKVDRSFASARAEQTRQLRAHGLFDNGVRPGDSTVARSDFRVCCARPHHDTTSCLY